MNSTHKDVSRRTVSAWLRGGSLAIAGLLVSTLAAVADGPATVCSGQPCGQSCERGAAMLSKLPYINRLFKNVGVNEAGADVERLGVDFDFEWIATPNGVCDFKPTCHEAARSEPIQCETAHCESACGGSACTTAARTKATCGTASCNTSACSTATGHDSACGKQACGAAACCESATSECYYIQPLTKSSGCQCCSDCACSCCTSANKRDKHVVRSCTCTKPAVAEKRKQHKDRLKAALAAKQHLETLLETHVRFEEAKQELLENLMASLVEKAQLEAQLAVAHERQALLQTVADVTAENAKLKAQLDLASEREQLLVDLAKATRENQELKARMANLAARLHKHAPHKPQTAAETRGETPLR